MRPRVEEHDIFGGKRTWNEDDWTDSDDRVRGGKSQSYMQFHKHAVSFEGNLDINTLGGAGFASQRTAADNSHWDLSDDDGIVLTVDAQKSDQKRYTFILKDAILPKDPKTGREQSTVSWEYDFRVVPDTGSLASPQNTKVYIPWSAFTPTFRGRKKAPDHPLNLKDIRRMSVMMRSFFGSQKGSFCLRLDAISAYQTESGDLDDSREAASQSDTDSLDSPVKSGLRVKSPGSASMWSWLCICCRL